MFPRSQPCIQVEILVPARCEHGVPRAVGITALRMGDLHVHYEWPSWDQGCWAGCHVESWLFGMCLRRELGGRQAPFEAQQYAQSIN
ncbi:hypothetical protein MFUL124B02_05760 [Myxococcus fulvus 124B02]|nr:hypothetical protein MFUL124B02_05760 [Myxococcus fulvus 124B02]